MITIGGRWFRDDDGRVAHLRGVNLGGSSKVPFRPNGATWRPDSLDHPRDVSFVGRPFPLEEADAHFGRIRAWGFNCLRFLVTWEAIEHAGPGQYDEAYLDYVRAVVAKAAEYDLLVFIDPHQDVWSRFTGGDGAPGWTFDVLGIDRSRLVETGAALTHQAHGDPLPRMIWPSNYSKFACATLFTLFFGGDDFAPRKTVDGVAVQTYLQQHLFDAIKQVALRLRDLPHVLGYETLNEPSQGYIGYPELDTIVAPAVTQGATPTIWQSMLLAAGYPQDVANVLPFLPLAARPKTVRVNPRGVSLWRDGVAPVWRDNGVWDVDRAGNPVVLRPDHFGRIDNRPVSFDRDYFKPFADRFAQELRQVDPDALIFVSPAPAEMMPFDAAGGDDRDYAPETRDGIVHAPHWYDAITLGLQLHVPWIGFDAHARRLAFGRKQVHGSFARQIKRLVDRSVHGFGGAPTLIGETGIAFNLNGKTGYASGDFSVQTAAMDRTMRALEATLVDFTLWNYSADNSNERGDQWNDEDLSIFSRDQMTGSGDSYDGGRALEAVIRPHARFTPGTPLRLSFDRVTKQFVYEFQADPAVEGPLELYVPTYHYPNGYRVEAPNGQVRRDLAAQRLFYTPRRTKRFHAVRLWAR